MNSLFLRPAIASPPTQARMNDPMYDLVIGLSGGKDSLSLLVNASMEGLKPLGVCVDTGFLAPVAVRNVIRATDELGVDCVFVKHIRRQFADIYHKHLASGTMCSDDPFAVCAECHMLIDTILRSVADQHGCTRVWSGFSPDNAVLLPPRTTIADVERDTGIEFPFCHKGKYSASAVRAFVKESIPGLILSPLRTNCAINYLLIDLYARAHGHNPYDRFFRQGQVSGWRWKEWFARKSGYIAWRARKVRRRLREHGPLPDMKIPMERNLDKNSNSSLECRA